MTFPTPFHQHTNAPLITPLMRDFGHGIYALDSGYFRDEFDAVHLVVEAGRVAVIDTSTQYAVPRILGALSALGLGPDAVDWILLTHVHLDHAGGAGALLRHCPNARVTVHPRGSRHLIDPSKLWAAVCEVYGKPMAEKEYGGLDPIDPDIGRGQHDAAAGRWHGRTWCRCGGCLDPVSRATGQEDGREQHE